MPNLSFKKEVEVRVVHGTTPTRYKIDVTEIEFGQTFQEKSYEVKTLHNQSSFEGSVINRANPAEFSLSFYLVQEDKHKILFDRLLDSATFDMYISNPGSPPLGSLPDPVPDQVWKLENCVIQDGNFEINKSRPLRLSISGEAAKLSKFSGTIPGSEPAATTSTYIVPTLATLTLGSDDVSSSVIGVTVELQNDIQWNRYDTLQGAAAVTNVATTMYPSAFTQGKQVLGGSIQKYLNERSTSVLTWDSDTSFRLQAGKDVGKTVTGITLVSQGSGYNSVPDVTISGGGGTGATATATLTGTSVTGLTLTNPGTGYTSVPTVTITESPGSYANATGTATIAAEKVVYGVDFNISNCSFTNRMSAGGIFGEEYNWRMTQRPTALSSVITYTTT